MLRAAQSRFEGLPGREAFGFLENRRESQLVVEHALAGGLACGLVTRGGASIGLLTAVGGAALGLGLSIGGFAVGSVAIGGAAIGFLYAIGGAAFGPATIDATHCDEAVLTFARRWLNTQLPGCQ